MLISSLFFPHNLSGTTVMTFLIEFLTQIKTRNEPLFYFGLVSLVFAVVCLAMTWLTDTQVYNVNAWFKPFKFAVSTWLFVWAMAWYCAHLIMVNVSLYSWTTIILLAFEIVYIAIQAGRGQLSHFNVSTPMYSMMYSMMAGAITIVTIYTAYVGVMFFKQDFPELPAEYVWAIRLSILIFVVFAFEGFVMGSRLTHTIGGPDGGAGLPLVGWSTKFGDPRVAHFVGMHALQVLPLLAWFVIRNTKGILAVSVLYALLACFVLVQALQGKPVWRGATEQTITQTK
jgi:hypothetical protein